MAARFAALIDCLTAGNNSVGSVCNAVAQFESVLFERTTNWGTYLSTTVLEAETVCVRQAAAGILPLFCRLHWTTSWPSCSSSVA